MPRFLVLGDIHDQIQEVRLTLDRVKHLGPFSGVLCVGDISSSLRRRWNKHSAVYDRYEINEFFNRVQELILVVGEAFPGTPFRFVPGNHDLSEGYWQKGVGIEENIDGKTIEIDGVKIHGLGGSLGQFGFPYEDPTEAKFEARIRSNFHASPPTPNSIVLAHSPPFGYCDQTAAGHLAGSKAVRDWVHGWTGVMFCGHIHEAAGTHSFGRRMEDGTEVVEGLVVNCGSFGNPYPAGYVVVLDFEPNTGSTAVNFYHKDGFIAGRAAALGATPAVEPQNLYPPKTIYPFSEIPG